MSRRIVERPALSAGDTISAKNWIAETRRAQTALERGEPIGTFEPDTAEYFAYNTGVLLACAGRLADLLEKTLPSNGGAR